MKVQRHARPPAVCPACLDAFFASISAADDRIGFVFCSHRGGTLVRVEIRAGAIVNWRLSAPLTLEQAQAAIEAHGRALEAAGLLATPPGGPGDVH